MEQLDKLDGNVQRRILDNWSIYLNKNLGKPDSIINSWSQPVGAQKNILKNIWNLKVSLCSVPTIGQADWNIFLVVVHIKGENIIKE